jgi:uncharacterized protein YdiU (UPF0061 family)
MASAQPPPSSLEQEVDPLPYRDLERLSELAFDNRLTRELPPDPSAAPGSRQVVGAAFSRVEPVAVPNPRLVAWSAEVAAALGLDGDGWVDDEAARILSGDLLPAGSDPHAMSYGGHQFGNWAGQLGDGRAITLGEVIDRDGQHQVLQLKGAGPTPYSRGADGYAVLRSSIREFLCSEAMHHLGIPTTRALSLTTTGSDVVRDILYDGHPRPEPGAVVCRVAPSFLRFGTYQLPAARGDHDLLRRLVDFTVVHYFDHLGPPSPDTYVAWFDEVCASTCDLVVDWMRVGFVHGVLNTDNMSIHGLTIDYGPYGWLDDFDPDWTPNTTDAGTRRYRYRFQPQIAQWNLLQLANAIYPLVGEPQGLEATVNGFVARYRSGFRAMMLAKLGLDPSDDPAGDDELIAGLLAALAGAEIDMTIFFRSLGALDPSPTSGPEADRNRDDPLGVGGTLIDAFYHPEALTPASEKGLRAWLNAYRARVAVEGRDPAERARAMNAVNPRYVLRNYLAQEAIDAAEQGDVSGVRELLDVMRRPYDDQPGRDRFAAKRPDWARDRPGCSMLSCSS